MFRTLMALPLLLLLGGITLAQNSPEVAPTPGVGSTAASEAESSIGAAVPAPGMEQPAKAVPYCRTVHVVRRVVMAVLALSASFAFIALGIFLIRRSTPR
jgi:hypothetical protein